jgi:hypothetical protein
MAVGSPFASHRMTSARLKVSETELKPRGPSQRREITGKWALREIYLL